jgi:hypothetical protein
MYPLKFSFTRHSISPNDANSGKPQSAAVPASDGSLRSSVFALLRPAFP